MSMTSAQIIFLVLFLLFFPISLTADLCLFLNEKRAFWSVGLYTIIPLSGGELHEEKGTIQIFRKNKILEISLSDFLKENKARFDTLKGFLLYKVQSVIQIGTNNFAASLFIAHSFSVLTKTLFPFLRTFFPETKYRTCYVVSPEKEGFLGVFHTVFWFTPLLLLLAFFKTLLNKGLEYVKRKKQKQQAK